MYVCRSVIVVRRDGGLPDERGQRWISARRTTAVMALPVFLEPSDSEAIVGSDDDSEYDANDQNCGTSMPE
jgi:hypothetical protein